MNGFRRLADHDVHQGYVWRVVTADFEAPDGTIFHRDIVRSPGAVSVVPLSFDADGTPRVAMVCQWRPPLEREVWEIPAGMRDVPGEEPAATALRELIEEVGLSAATLTLLTSINPSAGLTDSETYIYLGTDLTVVERDLHGPEEEHSRVAHFSLADALAMVESGEIKDAKTCVGLLLLDRRLRQGQHVP